MRCSQTLAQHSMHWPVLIGKIHMEFAAVGVCVCNQSKVFGKTKNFFFYPLLLLGFFFFFRCFLFVAQLWQAFTCHLDVRARENVNKRRLWMRTHTEREYEWLEWRRHRHILHTLSNGLREEKVVFDLSIVNGFFFSLRLNRQSLNVRLFEASNGFAIN